MQSRKKTGPEPEGLPSDGDLVRQCQEELPYETQTFEKLMRRYEPLVYNTCRKLIGNYEDAEEVSQEVFIKIFHQIKKFEGRSQFRTWMYKIVENSCKTRYASIAKRSEKENEYSQIVEETNLGSSISITQKIRSDLIEEALNQLSKDDKKIIVLRFVSGLSLIEISKILSLSLSATKMRFYRAMDKLREIYAGLGNK